MIECRKCGGTTPERRNFCRHCGRAIRDLKGLRVLGRTAERSRKLELFAATGDPAVFAKPGAPDFNPAYH